MGETNVELSALGLTRGTVGHLHWELKKLLAENERAKDAVMFFGDNLTFDALRPELWLMDKAGEIACKTVTKPSQHVNGVHFLYVSARSGDVLRKRHCGKTTGLSIQVGADQFLDKLNAMTTTAEQELFIVDNEVFFGMDKLLRFATHTGGMRYATVDRLRSLYPFASGVLDSPKFMALFVESAFSCTTYTCKYAWDKAMTKFFNDPFAE